MKKTDFLILAVTASLAVPFVSPAIVLAQNAPSTFEECAAVPDDVERLACFDEVATARVPDTVTRMREAKAQQQKEEFGLVKPSSGDILDELAVSVIRIDRDLYGKAILHMEDGSVWKQNDTKVVYYPKTLTGIIKKGMMGSFIFSPDTKDRAIKVVRQK